MMTEVEGKPLGYALLSHLKGGGGRGWKVREGEGGDEGGREGGRGDGVQCRQGNDALKDRQKLGQELLF